MRSDEYYMKRALALARRGQGLTSPNPMVGAVVVSEDGEIIAEGYHKRFGALHAERDALEKLDYKARGCTLYVNLEPCCHWGKTPPCTEAIIKAGIKRVVVGTLDPNPLVAGKGVSILKQHGVEVKVGVLEELCRKLNRGFFKWIRQKRPYVILKWAQTLDGKLATLKGDSRWISSSVALRHAHRLRAFADAVLVGKQTALLDNPELTVRLCKGVSPVRVVLDERMELPLDLKLFKTPPKTILFACRIDDKKARALEERGVEVVEVKGNDGVDLEEVLVQLGERGITTLLVEGGAKLLGSFIKRRLWDEIQVIVAPMILGTGRSVLQELVPERISEAVRFSLLSARRIGRDALVVLSSHEA